MNKIIFASLMGLVAGAIAHAVNPYFWWVGMIVGFIGGYVGYDWNETVEACRRAWLARVRERRLYAHPWDERRKTAYKRYVAYDLLNKMLVATGSAGVISWYLLAMTFHGLPELQSQAMTAVLWVHIGACAIAVFSTLVVAKRKLRWGAGPLEEDVEDIPEWKWLLISFLVLPFTAVAFAAYGVYQMMLMSARFARDVAFRILTERRLLFAVSCALGAPAAFFTHVWWVGAVVAPLSYAVLTKISVRYAVAK